MEELYGMRDGAMADPHDQQQLPVSGAINEFNNALQMETPRPVESLEQNNFPSMSMDDGLTLVDAWMAERQGLAFNDAQQERRVVVAPGIQAPGVTANGVALRHPLIKLPWYDQSAMASGCYPQEALTKVSAGTNLMVAPKAACMLRDVMLTPTRRYQRQHPKPGESVTIVACLEELTSRQSSSVLSVHSRRGSPSPLKVKGASSDTLQERRGTTHCLPYGAPVARKL